MDDSLDSRPSYNSASYLPNLPQLESFYFGLQLFHMAEAETALNQSWINLKRFGFLVRTDAKILVEVLENPFEPGKQYYKHSYEIKFELNERMRKQLTHFTSGIDLESQWAKPDRFLYRQFPLLTHLSINTSIPLETLLTRYGIHLLPNLETLQITSYYGMFMKNKIHPFIEQLMPPACTDVKFAALRRLIFVFSQHCLMDKFEERMPVLKQVRVYRNDPRILDLYNHCTKCLPDENYVNCERIFAESIRRWKIAPRVFYNDVEVLA